MDNDVSHFVAEQLLSLDARVTALEEAGGGNKPGGGPKDDVSTLPADEELYDPTKPAETVTKSTRSRS